MSRQLLLLCLALSLGGCAGCALDPGEEKDTSYISGCWEHIRNGNNSVFRD